MEPIIGITTGGRLESDFASSHYDSYFSVPSLYVEAVRRAGGIAVLLPPGELRHERLLHVLDGVIITGGSDIRPERYGGRTDHPALTKHDAERDDLEIELVRALVHRPQTPVLCVCRGMQVLNVALGGTLYEHIPDIREHDLHRNDKGLWTIHEVSVEDSLLADVMGKQMVNTYSGHHQAARDIAPDLRVVATAPDGIVEALEHRQHPWMIGVQWHPEKSAADDPTQQGLFDALVRAAVARPVMPG